MNACLFLHALPRPRTIEKVHEFERTAQLGRFGLQFGLFLTDAVNRGYGSNGRIWSFGLDGPVARSREHLYFLEASLFASFVSVMAFRLGFNRVVWGPKPHRAQAPPQ
jgi:hypothetical protein